MSQFALLTISVLDVIAGTRKSVLWDCKMRSDNPQRGRTKGILKGKALCV
jgi:hypothetical protein